MTKRTYLDARTVVFSLPGKNYGETMNSKIGVCKACGKNFKYDKRSRSWCNETCRKHLIKKYCAGRYVIAKTRRGTEGRTPTKINQPKDNSKAIKAGLTRAICPLCGKENYTSIWTGSENITPRIYHPKCRATVKSFASDETAHVFALGVKTGVRPGR